MIDDDVQARLDAAAEQVEAEDAADKALPDFYGKVTTSWGLFPGSDGAWVFQLLVGTNDDEPEGLGLEITEKQRHTWRDLQGDTVRQRTMFGLLELVAEGIAKSLWEQIDPASEQITSRKGEKIARAHLDALIAAQAPELEDA